MQIRKVLISAFGDVSQLSVVDAPLDDPAPNEVQVSVIYSGFSGADINMRMGRYPMQKKAPLTPGYCFLGTVRRTGASATLYKPGDVVSAVTVYDSESTAINIPEKYLVRVPDTVRDLQAAAALILDWSTAYGMVHRAAAVQKGHKVFVHGMSGAVGFAATSLALRLGADVYGTASERNHAALRELGATPFVYTDKKWMAAVEEMGGVDAIFDPLGYDSWDESFDVLAPHGILVGYGGNGATLNNEGTDRGVLMPTLKLLAKNLCPSKRTTFFYIARDQKTYRPEAETLMELLDQGEIAPRIKSVHALDDVKMAHEAWGKAPGMGSMLIQVAEEPKRA